MYIEGLTRYVKYLTMSLLFYCNLRCYSRALHRVGAMKFVINNVYLFFYSFLVCFYAVWLHKLLVTGDYTLHYRWAAWHTM